MFHLHSLEPQGIRANVPAPDGAMQSGHAVDFLSTTGDMHKAQAGITRSGAGEGGLAQEGIAMNHDEIIAMAHEAGFRVGHITISNGEQTPFIAPVSATHCLPEVLRFAALVAAKEREACAQVCDEMFEHYTGFKDTALLNGDVALSNEASGEPRACEFLASAIRARGAA